MKNVIFTLLANVGIVSFCLGQKVKAPDFVEFGIRTGRFIETSFLENSKYRDQLSDPATAITGLIASPTGKNYAAKFRYGKGLNKRAYLIAELGFAVRDEQVYGFCHICDNIPGSFTLVKINTFDSGVGLRYQIVNIGNFNFSVEGIGHYSVSTNELGLHYFGYSVHPLIQYRFRETLHLNLRYGFEQSFNQYEKKERYAELAVGYSIYRKAN